MWRRATTSAGCWTARRPHRQILTMLHRSAALMASTDRLAAMSRDLNAFLRLLGRVQAAELESYRAGLKSLTTDVREHLAFAAALIAELRPAP
jgi:hypothetical protein